MDSIGLTEMADMIEMERVSKEQKQKHLANGARQFCGNFAKMSGGGIEVTQAYNNGYVEKQPRTVAPSITINARRTR